MQNPWKKFKQNFCPCTKKRLKQNCKQTTDEEISFCLIQENAVCLLLAKD